MSKLLAAALLALAAGVSDLEAQRLLGVHADASGAALTVRIPNALAVIRETTTGAFHFRYGSTSTGTWIFSGIPAGTYEMWHSAPGFEPAQPYVLTNPVPYPASGDTWASAALQPNTSLPKLKFQVPTTTGEITLGTSIDLELNGQPFSSRLLFVSTAPQLPPVVLPGIGPLFALDLVAANPFYVVDLGPGDGGGFLFSSLPVPRDPTLQGGVLFLQGLELTQSFSLALANLLAIRFI
ncbi:MAG: carboxypeptidase regulatory-like domain-containing protein [Planctomycetes bacterium]|nr:carboxypeptidase regulatory-like domain-containing protein [Planctomycetota bacterium]